MGFQDVSKIVFDDADKLYRMAMAVFKSTKDPVQKEKYRQIALNANEIYKEQAAKLLKGRLAGSAGAVSSAGLAAPVAGAAGFGIGRVLGKTPLMTDSKMTYDQFYTQQFGNLINAFRAKKMGAGK